MTTQDDRRWGAERRPKARRWLSLEGLLYELNVVFAVWALVDPSPFLLGWSAAWLGATALHGLASMRRNL